MPVTPVLMNHKIFNSLPGYSLFSLYATSYYEYVPITIFSLFMDGGHFAHINIERLLSGFQKDLLLIVG